MPNWCYQTIIVRGPLEERQRLLTESRYSENSINEPEFMLSQLVPRDPRTIKIISSAGPEYAAFSMAADGFDGYLHTLELWGSKWGDCDTQAEEMSNETVIHTKSAWSTINPLIINVSKQFPQLAFCSVYTEEFNHFAGAIMIKDGKVLDEYLVDVEDIFFSKGLAPSTIDEEHEMFSKAEEKLWELVTGARDQMISDFEKVLG